MEPYIHTVHIDHFGPLPNTKHGCKHILLVVDRFTKFIILYTTKSTDSAEIIRHLRNYFTSYSRGTGFTSDLFENLLEDAKVKHVKIATQMPRTNEQAERLNTTITEMISKISQAPDQ